MADRTLTVNGQPFTFNRDRFAGVRTMTVSEPPLSDTTLRLQITVSGHVDISGVYERTSTSSTQYDQVGGNGNLHISETAGGTDDYIAWTLVDTSDNNPSTTVTVNGVTNTLPWQGLSEFAASGITLAPVSETVTVDRTAPVIDSDRKGESRPLLSKLVGGAAAAYSLRDLNDKAGNNKVVEVFRSSDNTDRIFLAKEVSNGTLEAWVGAGNDGFVSIWYDQSGNNNHAVQPTAGSQPKIVSAGNLVDGGLLFEGGQTIDTTATFTLASGSSVSLFTVNKATGSENGYLVKIGPYIIWRLGGGIRRVSLGANLDSGSISGNEELWVPIININSSGGTGNFFVDGTLTSTDTVVGSSVISNKFINIGGSGGSKWNGTINEIILYTSDQSANRPAIDANINNQYDIY